MATNGVLAVTDARKRVLLKTVSGCNGQRVHSLARWLRKHPTQDLSIIYTQSLALGLGCEACLIVMDREQHMYAGTAFPNTELAELYTQTFTDPKFNPRWVQGTADYLARVRLKEGR